MEKIKIISPHKPIMGTVEIGGSKSFTNRALIMASLAQGKSTLTSISISDDSKVLMSALSRLGITITPINETSIEIIGNGGKFKSQNIAIDVGHAGTAMRFLTALCCLVPGEIILDGSERMRERPLGDLLNALRSLGADIICTNKEGFASLLIRGGKINKSTVSMSGKVSSQFITALLLIAPVLKEGLEIQITDEQISKSYIEMTLASLQSFGVHIVNDDFKKYTVSKFEKLSGTQYQVEGDASGASYLLALAAISGGTVTVKNINPQSSQGDARFSDLLERMGCHVVKDAIAKTITVTGPQALNSISVDMSLMPDTAQTLAVVAAFVHGVTTISGLSTLRVKETNRLQATKSELKKIGIGSTITDDSITIHGDKPHGATIKTYKDHRMALAFSVVGSVVEGIKIEEPDVVNKSFPDFWKKIESLGIAIKKL